MSSHIPNDRPQPDQVLTGIVDYVLNYEIKNELAWKTAQYCLLDTLGCGLEALTYPACTKLMGPIVKGTIVPNGAKVPGTQFQLRAPGRLVPQPFRASRSHCGLALSRPSQARIQRSPRAS